MANQTPYYRGENKAAEASARHDYSQGQTPVGAVVEGREGYNREVDCCRAEAVEERLGEV